MRTGRRFVNNTISVLFLTLVSMAHALPSAPETESLLHENIIKNFLHVANNPNLYIYDQVMEFKKQHQNAQTPEGGIAWPIDKKHLEIMVMNSIWDRQLYCRDQGECVKESYKRILLIAIPTKVCDEKQCLEDKIYFQTKGGMKTSCRSKESTECFDSSIFYLPEEALIVLKD